MSQTRTNHEKWRHALNECFNTNRMHTRIESRVISCYNKMIEDPRLHFWIRLTMDRIIILSHFICYRDWDLRWDVMENGSDALTTNILHYYWFSVDIMHILWRYSTCDRFNFDENQIANWCKSFPNKENLCGRLMVVSCGLKKCRILHHTMKIEHTKNNFN